MDGRFVIDGAQVPMPRRGMDRRALGACARAAVVYVAVVDPHRRTALLPRCPTKLITRLDCPACGGLRLLHDLVHADLRAALHDNPFLLLAGPVLAVSAGRGHRDPSQNGTVEVSGPVAVGVAGAA